MNVYRKITLATLVVIAAAVVITPNAHAQILEEKVTVKFSEPVEIPGEVLPAGVYIFEAVENGHTTRIVSADEKKVYATLLTMPDQLLTEPMDQATVILGESPDGGPQRVTAWFYPGDSVGYQFIYAKTDSGKDLSSIMGSAAKATGSAATDTAKAVGASSEFLGIYSAHIAANSGRAIARAARYLVS